MLTGSLQGFAGAFGLEDRTREEESGTETAALSGGCFQNRLLLSFVEKGLAEAGMKVLIHHLVPPNDGGIALGQAVAARQALQDGLIPQT